MYMSTAGPLHSSYSSHFCIHLSFVHQQSFSDLWCDFSFLTFWTNDWKVHAVKNLLFIHPSFHPAGLFQHLHGPPGRLRPGTPPRTGTGPLGEVTNALVQWSTGAGSNVAETCPQQSCSIWDPEELVEVFIQPWTPATFSWSGDGFQFLVQQQLCRSLSESQIFSVDLINGLQSNNYAHLQMKHQLFHKHVFILMAESGHRHDKLLSQNGKYFKICH